MIVIKLDKQVSISLDTTRTPETFLSFGVLAMSAAIYVFGLSEPDEGSMVFNGVSPVQEFKDPSLEYLSVLSSLCQASANENFSLEVISSDREH